MKVRFVSENRVEELFNFLSDNRAEKICLVAATYRQAKKAFFNVKWDAQTGNDTKLTGFKNNLIVDCRGVGDGSKTDGYDCIVIVPDGIPTDVIQKIMAH